MPEKKAVSSAKPNVFVRIGRWFARLPKRIGNSFRNMWRELKKVTWPTRDKLINYTVIVVLFMLFMMIVIGLLDTGASSLINLLLPKA